METIWPTSMMRKCGRDILLVTLSICHCIRAIEMEEVKWDGVSKPESFWITLADCSLIWTKNRDMLGNTSHLQFRRKTSLSWSGGDFFSWFLSLKKTKNKQKTSQIWVKTFFYFLFPYGLRVKSMVPGPGISLNGTVALHKSRWNYETKNWTES